ncbi:MAG: hypothetical protein ACYCS0_01215 [bacterium]
MENNEFKWLNFNVSEYIVYILLDNSSEKMLLESNNYYNFGKYSARLDNPHFSDGQKHIHLYARGNQLFALNKDGTAHDGKLSHQKSIPNVVADFIRNEFPYIKIPVNNLIENASRSMTLIFKMQLLNE